MRYISSNILKLPSWKHDFWHLLKRGLGTLGSHVPGGKAALQRPVAPPVIKIHQCPNGNSSIN